MPDPEELEPALVSDPIPFTLSAVSVCGAGGILDAPRIVELDGGGSLTDEERRILITRVRAGAHLELEVPITAFVQEDGKPNKKGMRFKTSTLSTVATSYVGKPMLVDHRSWSQSARMGTILASTAIAMPGGKRTEFRQKLRVVKPDAVISVLDGTIDRFSIGWNRGSGEVTCSVHGNKVDPWEGRYGCDCWPLQVVMVDGEPKIVEYEFTSAEGDETSAVVLPASGGTKIESIRAALAAAIRTFPPPQGHPLMNLTRLAAILGMSALSTADEDRAVLAANELVRRASAAEAELALYKDRALTAEGALATARTELATLTATRDTADINAQVDRAYREGKLSIQRDAEGKRIESKTEAALRKAGKTLGVAGLTSYVDEMPVIVPVGQRAVSEALADNLPRTETGIGAESLPGEILDSVADQLGLDHKTVRANARELGTQRLGVSGARATVPYAPAPKQDPVNPPKER